MPDTGAIFMAQTELGGLQEITLHEAGNTLARLRWSSHQFACSGRSGPHADNHPTCMEQLIRMDVTSVAN
jgi:hypothetical protein